MTSSGGTPPLSAQEAEAFVRDWHARLTAEVPADELLAHLANGLRLELPTGIVRGPQEFRTWYEAGLHGPLADGRMAAASVEVAVTSPVHAQLTLTFPDPAEDGTGSGGRQEWWVVRQGGALRLRTIVVSAPASRPTAAPEPAVAEPVFA